MIKKTVFRILIIGIFFLTICVNVFADTVVYEYNKVNIAISFVMKVAILIIVLAYIIFLYNCLKKTKKDKIKRTKKLIAILLIAVIISIGLWFGAETVLEAGKTIKNLPMYMSS